MSSGGAVRANGTPRSCCRCHAGEQISVEVLHLALIREQLAIEVSRVPVDVVTLPTPKTTVPIGAPRQAEPFSSCSSFGGRPGRGVSIETMSGERPRASARLETTTTVRASPKQRAFLDQQIENREAPHHAS